VPSVATSLAVNVDIDVGKKFPSVSAVLAGSKFQNKLSEIESDLDALPAAQTA
jgi:hypothetical protein